MEQKLYWTCRIFKLFIEMKQLIVNGIHRYVQPLFLISPSVFDIRWKFQEQPEKSLILLNTINGFVSLSNRASAWDTKQKRCYCGWERLRAVSTTCSEDRKNSFAATLLWEMRLALLTCGQCPLRAKQACWHCWAKDRHLWISVIWLVYSN